MPTLEDIAAASGDISSMLDAATIERIGTDVLRDYEADLKSRSDWEDEARAALKRAAQEKVSQQKKEFPFAGASDVDYPLLTVAAGQFNARAYPAIVKGDEVVSVKIVGADRGRQAMAVTPQGASPKVDEQGQPVWERPPGAKASRAQRVKEYLNTYVMYRMEGWEADTDLLLYQLPIIGCAFRKSWWNGKQNAKFVSALRLIAPMDASDIKTVPRLTEEVDEYPYQISAKMVTGEYRAVTLQSDTDDRQKPRVILEQHCRIDLDGDGLDEPYIVKVDKAEGVLLRIEPNFGPESIQTDGTMKARCFYTKYDMFPHPEGKFYGIGFGHLLKPVMDIVNTALNQLIDTGTAMAAGGGFIASGLRLQGAGQSSRLSFSPGEYKSVSATGAALREQIYELTRPAPSPITFQILDLMLGAAKEIASIKDVTSGDASNQGQVGTTLALIEQGLVVFTAIYKRVYRSLKDEFGLLYNNLAEFGGEDAAKDYAEILDDDAADFAADFSMTDMDIRPVSDPNAVTSMQKMARAGFLLQQRGTGLNDVEIARRALEAADIEDIDALMPSGGPDPAAIANLEKVQSETDLNRARAEETRANAAQKGAELGAALGEKEGYADTSGLRSLEKPPGNANGDGGAGAEGDRSGASLVDGELGAGEP